MSPSSKNALCHQQRVEHDSRSSRSTRPAICLTPIGTVPAGGPPWGIAVRAVRCLADCCGDRCRPGHPVSRCRRRAGREGRELRRPAGRGRPGRARPPLRRAGCRRADVPRHHRVVGRAGDHLRRGAAHRRAGVHPADCRRRRAQRRRRRRAAARRRRQGRREHRRDRPSGAASPRSRSASATRCWCSPPTCAGCARASAPTPSGFEVTTHGGRQGTGIDAVEWVQPGGRARRGGDPAQLDGRRRHEGRLRP